MGPKRTNKKKKKGNRKLEHGSSSKTVCNAHAGGSFAPSKQRSTDAGSSGSGLYSRYKAATQSFRDSLASLLPPSMPLVAVSDLGTAAEFLLGEAKKAAFEVMTAKNSALPISTPQVGAGLLTNLNESIKLREEVSGAFRDDDMGHAYMIRMLRYCRDLLRRCRKIQLSILSTQKRSALDVGYADEIGSRFDALRVGGESEEEEDEAGESDGPIERPKDPDRPYSIQDDLIDGSDRERARIYLFQVEMLFDMVNYHFRRLKRRVRTIIEDNELANSSAAETAMLTVTMQAAAATNMALEEIRFLEEALKAEKPHIKTFYHLLAVLIFSSNVDQLTNMTNPKVKASNPYLSLDFVAQEVEYGFRTPMDPDFYKGRKRIELFMKKAKVTCSNDNIGMVEAISRVILTLTFLEVQTDYFKTHADTPQMEQFLNLRDLYCRETGQTPAQVSSMWNIFGRTGTRNIVEDKSILHTHSLIQSSTHMIGVLTKNAKLAVTRPLGPDWEENNNKAKGTTDACMDDLLLRIIYPQWIEKVRDESHKLLFQDKLPSMFPFLLEFIGHLERGDCPVPLSLSIAVHAMMTGILCLQGDGDIKRIAMLSKSASQKLFEQIGEVIDSKHGAHTSLLKKIKSMELVTIPAHGNDISLSTELVSFWNPLVAGSFLSFITYLGSILPGAAMIDSSRQTVVTLHLYNALRARGLIEEMPFLEYLDSILKDSKAIWGDGKPCVGDFTKAYFLALGESLSASSAITKFVQSAPWRHIKAVEDNRSEQERAEIEDQLARVQTIGMQDSPEVLRLQVLYGLRGALQSGRRKDLRSVNPDDISLSFRYYVDRDFSGNVEDTCSGNSVDVMSYAGTFVTLKNYFNRTNALVEQMAKELLSLNIPKLAMMMTDFLYCLAGNMGWQDTIDECCSGFLSHYKLSNEGKKLGVLLTIIGDRVLSELDFEKEDARCEESKKVAALMKTFFDNTDEPWFF